MNNVERQVYAEHESDVARERFHDDGFRTPEELQQEADFEAAMRADAAHEEWILEHQYDRTAPYCWNDCGRVSTRPWHRPGGQVVQVCADCAVALLSS